MVEANTQNPQAQMQQAQVQFVNDVITHAGLDANNPQHQKAAIDVLNNIQQMQSPEREKEFNAVLREFGIQPDEYKRNIQTMQQQAKSLEGQAQNLDQQGNDLVNKSKKRGMIQSIIALVGAVAAGYFAFGKLKEKKALPKYGGTAGAGIVGGLITSWVASLFTTRPLRKQAEELDAQKQQLGLNYQQLKGKEQEYQYNTLRNLASGMLKERASKAAATVAPKVETAPPAASAAPTKEVKEAPAEATFTEKVNHHGKSAPEKILEQQVARSAVEKVEASKEAAAEQQSQIS